MPAIEQDRKTNQRTKNGMSETNALIREQVRFNVLRVLPRTGKQVKQFTKF